MEITFGSAIASLLITENPQIMVAIAVGISAIFGVAVVAFTTRKNKEKRSVVNEDHIGHVMKETDGKIVIIGSFGYRFDVPKSKIKEVGRNVILNMDVNELMKYKVDRNAPLPT